MSRPSSRVVLASSASLPPAQVRPCPAVRSTPATLRQWYYCERRFDHGGEHAAGSVRWAARPVAADMSNARATGEPLNPSRPSDSGGSDAR